MVLGAGNSGGKTSGSPPAVVLGLGVNGLGVTRSLGNEGIPVVGVIVEGDSAGRSSRYLTRILRMDHLRFSALADALGDGLCVLIPCSDHIVGEISANRDSLPENFRFVLPPKGVVDSLMDKSLFAREAARYGLPIPTTVEIKGCRDISRTCRELEFPCILKPSLSEEWKTAGAIRELRGAKAFQVESAGDVAEIYRRVKPFSERVVVQERIDGPDSSLYSVLSYIDRSGSPVCTFVGRKWRMIPVHAGVGTLVESVQVPELVSVCLRFLEKIGYIGASDICFKLDPNGDFKAFEINLRTNMWNSLALASGVNIPLAIWRDALGFPAKEVHEYRSGVRWMDILNDLSAFRQYRRGGELKFWDYLRSLSSVRSFAYLHFRDPVPFFDRLIAKGGHLLEGRHS